MWRAITEDDLRSAITAAEDTAFRTKLLAEGQSDPFEQIFGQMTLTFREAIRSCAENRLDPDPTKLPEAAIFHAVAIIRHRLCTRFDVGELTEARMVEYRTANNYLNAVAACDRKVEQPGGDEAAKPKLPSPAVNQSPRRDGWRNQDGI